MADVVETLLTLISDEIAPIGEPIERDTDLLLTGAVDSLGVVRIVQWMEDTYELQIDPVDVTLENFQTVDAMVVYLEARRASVA